MRRESPEDSRCRALSHRGVYAKLPGAGRYDPGTEPARVGPALRPDHPAVPGRRAGPTSSAEDIPCRCGPGARSGDGGTSRHGSAVAYQRIARPGGAPVSPNEPDGATERPAALETPSTQRGTMPAGAWW